MTLNEFLLNLKNKLQNEKTVDEKECDCISLSQKIEDYLSWYKENRYIYKFNYLKNLIEKMAIWYELRYPDYEVAKLTGFDYNNEKDISDIMFNQNEYINKELDETDITRAINWIDFYNFNAFLSSLPEEERELFKRPKYTTRTSVIADCFHLLNLYLTKNGKINKITPIRKLNDLDFNPQDLLGKNIKEAREILIGKYHCSEKSLVKLDQAIKDYDDAFYQKDEMLNCVLYKIIERGGYTYGPRRGFLFALEFNRNINIPMMYGVGFSCEYLKEFINIYLKAGGRTTLECYPNYFADSDKDIVMTIDEILKNECDWYTEEERDLAQRLINSLVYKMGPDTFKKIKVEENMQKRILRKLEEKKNNEK